MPVKHMCFPVEPSRMSKRGALHMMEKLFSSAEKFSSGLHGKYRCCGQRTVREWPLWHAAKSKAPIFARRRS
ncbi:hypothetical protein TNCV_4445941 [Trichonephila clavipes]|nr:hypothetical protein TNCV_4445941 [Trichonephila clavipes]